jgi:hypothetical protein
VGSGQHRAGGVPRLGALDAGPPNAHIQRRLRPASWLWKPGANARFDSCGQVTELTRLSEQTIDGALERSQELLGRKRLDQCAVKGAKELWRQIVETAREPRGKPSARAREVERVVAHSAGAVLRLPESAAVDACPRVPSVGDAPPEDILRVRTRWRR